MAPTTRQLAADPALQELVGDLIPKADQWIQNAFNVLLIGAHGVGKSEAILTLAKKHGIRVKYYSCATLDPYTDLVGVPVPRTDENGVEYLQQIRPRDVDGAEWIVFDEYNRAPKQVRNACMEMMQFHTINGEPLPDLRMCWAAVNPDTGDYDTEAMDLAQEDRFDVYHEMRPIYSLEYMHAAGMPRPIARALVQWVTEHDKERDDTESQRDHRDSISPRRLMKIGQAFLATNDPISAIPPRIDCERQKLERMLQGARRDYEEIKRTGKLRNRTMGRGAYDGLTYETAWLRENRDDVVEYLSANPDDLDTHDAVLNVIRGIHAPRLLRDHAETLNALKPSVLEGYVDGITSQRRDLLASSLEAEVSDERREGLTSLQGVLAVKDDTDGEAAAA